MFKLIYNGENDTKARNVVFSETIEELVQGDPSVVYLDADLMNSVSMYDFWINNPENAFNIGIAEANMMGIAGGLSAAGKKPFVHTFAPFATRRSFDQVFLSIGYAGNSVRIFGSDPGVTAAFNGGTHMCFEDMALMRSIPEASVFDVVDNTQFKWLLKTIKDKKGISYFRSSRQITPKVYHEDSTFEIGKGNLLKDGTDLTIIACGIMVVEALEAAKLLEKENIYARVIDMFTVKPIDVEIIIESAQKTEAIVTVENHNVIGGLGDAVSSVLSQNCPTRLMKHGVQDRFGEVGSVDYLQEVYKLRAVDIVESCKKVLNLKQC